jgi:hypothetical protein
MSRFTTPFAGAAVAVAVAGMIATIAPVSGQTQTAKPAATAKPAPRWVMPRTPDGKPDLQGNWTNETQTPLERMGKQGATLTKEEAKAIEDRAKAVAEFRDKDSDPNRPTPTKGGDARVLTAPGEPSFIERISEAAGGKVGGYNGFWLAPGDKVITIDGVARSSIIVDPPDGHIPAVTAEARQRAAARAAATKGMGEFDHPELRPLGERCLLSFGSNAGPPMLPNYFYNNNYTIVQTKDHVMILSEMVHDVRIIRLKSPSTCPRASARGSAFDRSLGEGDTRRRNHPIRPAAPGLLYLSRGVGEPEVERYPQRPTPIVYKLRWTIRPPSRRRSAATRSIAMDEPVMVTAARGTTRCRTCSMAARESAKRRRRTAGLGGGLAMWASLLDTVSVAFASGA